MVHTYRTTRCEAAGHREVTLQLEEEQLVPGLEGMLLDYFESAVARGTQFLPGQTVQLGWATLRLCERSDGTIGVQERELTPSPTWTESVDRALMDTWLQQEVCASVGLLDALAFPRQDHGMLVADCADSDDVILSRLETDEPEDFSGWSLTCADNEHDHGERTMLPLLALAANQPGLVQFLALPRGTIVLATYREKADAPEGTLRLEPHVFRGGKKLAFQPGSYLARLAE